MRMRVLAVALMVGLFGAVSPVPRASADTVNPAFGFNYNPLVATGSGFLSGAAARPLQDQVRAGSIHRFGIWWQEFEQSQGVYDFTSIDQRIKPLVQNNGLRILPILFNAPTFYRSGFDNLICGNRPCPPADTASSLAAWQEATRRLVSHFSTGDYAGKLAGLEVWNEPNFRSYWATMSGPNPVRFAHLLCRAHAGVRQVSSTLPVVLGGLIPWDDDNPVPSGDTQSKNLATFLSGVYATSDAQAPNPRNCMDAVGVHNYPLGTAPDAPTQPFLDAFSDLRALFASNGDEGRRIWATEVGYGQGDEDGDVATELEQAEKLVCMFQVAVDQPDVDAVIVHSLSDIPDDGTWGNMGVYHWDGTANPPARLSRDWLRDLFIAYPNGNVPPVTSCGDQWRP